MSKEISAAPYRVPWVKRYWMHQVPESYFIIALSAPETESYEIALMTDKDER